MIKATIIIRDDDFDNLLEKSKFRSVKKILFIQE
jgi:hypothetical protein